MDTSRDIAETAVLGAVLLAETALDILVGERLRPEHFRRDQHRIVYGAMLALRDQGRSIDTVTLKARFDSPQSPISPGQIELLAASVGNLSGIRDYCRIILEGAWFDEAADVLLEAEDALKRRDRSDIERALGRLDNVEGDTAHVDTRTEFLDWYDAEQKGWPLPFAQLTSAVGGGLVPGEPTVIGGWSGMGKTFWLSQVLRSCVKAGASVREYANEMHGPKRTARTLCAMTGIPAGLIARKGLSQQQTTRVLDALKLLPYETQATAGWRVEDYCRDIRKFKPDVAAIDTVNNLPCSRVDEWDRACVMLCDAAAQSGTHLILVCQLNLERDKGKKPPPVGRDLRSTGAWYQRARVVMFIHRDQESTSAGDGEQIWRSTPSGHIRIEKATHGDGDPVTGFLPVEFNPKWLRFDEDTTANWRDEVAA